jgi:hypothetical protein
MDQILLHKDIDKVIKAGPEATTVGYVKELIAKNFDARMYFYTTADNKWLTWLWSNGFLSLFKEKPEDTTKYSYKTPELDYLSKMASLLPAEVVDIILDVPISKENFNPEVIDRFLWTARELPASEVARIVSKIKVDGWIQLMYPYNRWGYEYTEILEKLVLAEDYDNALVLVEAMLAIRTKEEVAKTANGFGTDNPFYFQDLGQTKIFETLVNLGTHRTEELLKLTTDTMRKIVLMGDKQNISEIFEVNETFYLFDIDFFEIGLDDKKHLSYRDDVRSLAATIKNLTEIAIGEKCERDSAKRLYETYINSLPFSRSMWRLRLFVLSLCPEVFKEELRTAFFKIFDTDKYHELESGAEYHQALKKSFSVLSEDEKRLYIRTVLKYFGQEREDKKEEGWRKRDGRQILSCIFTELSDDEKNDAEKILGGHIDPNFKPEPSIGQMKSGSIRALAPATPEDIASKTIEQIVGFLKTEWSPANLKKSKQSKDFFNPLNSDGTGELLQGDIPLRLSEYIRHSELFFDREALSPQYTYAFLRGVYDSIKQNRPERMDEIFILLKKVVASGLSENFDPKSKGVDDEDGWVATWSWVHNAITDLLKELLIERNDKIPFDFDSLRNDVFEVISYLFTFPSPTVEDNDRKDDSDPFSIAINSVRGRSFECLDLFVYLDGKKFDKDADSRISPDVKNLYEVILKNEYTYALMFMFGHHLPTFYYRDKAWMSSLLKDIFSENPAKKGLYMATWEGYISTNLFKELFEDFQPLYERAIDLNPEDYTKRKYFKDLDEGLATHMALAYMHFDDFTLKSDLFKKFWDTPNTKRHSEFVSFMGRHTASRSNARTFMADNEIKLDKIKKFWDWVLGNKDDKKVFSSFGLLMNNEHGLFENKWLAKHVKLTLEKSNGEIDWEYGVMKSLPEFSVAAPEDTLAILRSYLLNRYADKDAWRDSVYLDTDIFKAFQELYKNPAIKSGVYDLISQLLPHGRGRFWGLKDILKQID